MEDVKDAMVDLKKLIREIPDYPKPGILFYDLTTLLQDPRGFHTLVDRLCEHYNGHKVDIVAGIEARGFIFAPALAYRLNAGFVPIRKPKKLPAKTMSVTYQLEYATDSLEIHADAIKPGQHVLLCDDLLATGGTAAAAINLIRQLGGEITGAAFAVELNFLNGRAKLPGIRRLLVTEIRQVAPSVGARHAVPECAIATRTPYPQLCQSKPVFRTAGLRPAFLTLIQCARNVETQADQPIF